MKCKKTIIIFLITLLLLLTISNTFADTDTSIDDEVQDVIEDIDGSKIEAFYNDIGDDRYSFGASFKEIVQAIAQGKVYTFQDFLDLIIEGFRDSLDGLVQVFIFILAVIALTSITSSFSIMSIDSVSNASSMLSYASISATVLSIVVAAVSTVTAVLGNITTLINAFFPVILTLTTALGGVNTSGIISTMSTTTATIIINVINTVVLPLFSIAMIFTLIGNLYNRIQLNNLSKLAKNLSEWVLGIVFSLFSIVLGAQGIVGNSLDTIAYKSTKFAMSTYVPVLGGYLSDGFDVVLAGCLIVKNSVGFAGIIIVLLIVVAPSIRIFVVSIVLKLLGSIAEPLGLTSMSTMLYKSGENLRVLIAILLGVGFILIAMLVLIITFLNQGVV